MRFVIYVTNAYLLLPRNSSQLWAFTLDREGIEGTSGTLWLYSWYASSSCSSDAVGGERFKQDGDSKRSNYYVTS